MPYSDDPEQLVEELFLQIEREKRAAWTQRRRSGESGSIGSMSGGVEWTFASVRSSLSSLRAV